MTLRLRFVFALLLLACLPATVAAQTATFVPNPADPGSNVHMQFTFPIGNCGQVPTTTTVTRNGSAIQVSYVLALPVGTVCIGVPPPNLPVDLALGAFAPGAYTVTANGIDQTTGGTQLPTVTGGFIVNAASSVPATSPLLAALFGMLAAAAGGFALHRRAAR